MKKNVLILGAAGRDFHNFNMFFRGNDYYNVVGFTATQIPNITERKYPPELAGKFYPKGIPIFEETELEKLIEKYKIDEVYLSYSDISHKTVMNLACRSEAKGASFVLLGPRETMLKSKKKVIAVTAVRTGAGKSTLSRAIAAYLKEKGKRFVIIRHPMPYGDLVKQKVQRFAKLEDLDKYECTIEEREEYEPHIQAGVIVYSGVDYKEILAEAEKEADYIIWDGGNNDIPFIKPNLHIVVADSLRPGHELWYYPGETNFRMADVILINKVSESETDVKRILNNAQKVNPSAAIFQSDMLISSQTKVSVKGKKVVVVEDGPTVTHGEMKWGAGFEYARRTGAIILDPREFAVGSIKETYSEYEHMGNIVPALGYYGKQLKELEETLNRSKAAYIVSGTPIELKRLLKIDIPIIQVTYTLQIKDGDIGKMLKKIIK
ncbi:GTPase [Candidatus Micrarchaeota archaeon]|nr:GTPase [Candidatus Micrarchaeota archaeon]